MALNKIHNAVKNALIKDVWEITAENFQFQFMDLELDGDLEAQKIFADERIENIYIVIKDFFGASILSDFETAFGKFVLLKTVYSEIKSDFKTYLAFSEYDYNNFFRTIIEEDKIPFFVFDLKNETITKWNN